MTSTATKTKLKTRPARHPATIQRVRKPGLDATIVNRDELTEYHITVRPLPGERTGFLLWRLDAFLREHGATLVRQETFGSISAHAELTSRMHRLFGDSSWPVTWVEGGPCTPNPVCGIHVFALAGCQTAPLLANGRVVGTVFSDHWARHCLLGGILPSQTRSGRSEQTSQVFCQIESNLAQAGLTLSDLVRTWFFLDDILSWYGPFNAVRSEIFTQRNLFGKGMPASTGIGAKNPAQAAVVAGAWAAQPLDGPMRIQEIESPLQCSARSYGSCFSRATELLAPGHRRLFISGTASIAPDGRTSHVGNPRRQIQLTMDVVEAILRSRKLGWANVTRATGYLRSKADAPLFDHWMAERRMHLPIILTEADVCRDDLLFEIEVDAVALTNPHQLPK